MIVSVYVPCYNGAAWLAECLEALLAQTRSAALIAVVDDGSTDDSAAIVQSFGKRVRLIQHERNRGLAVARNTALAEIGCDVLASVDADVRAEHTWLGELLAGFESPRTVAVGGRLDEAYTKTPADRWRAAHMAQHAGDFPLVNPPVLPGANTAVRPAVVRQLGGYDESFRTNYEDADLQHRLIERGYRCRYVPAARARHLRTDTPQSVLRTFWGWLRPPDERRGAFDTVDGLCRRQRDLSDVALRALWVDIAANTPEVAYLSLCAGMLFPLADANYAATRAVQAGNAALAASCASTGDAWRRTVRGELRPVTSRLAQTLDGDLNALAWWSAATPDTVQRRAAGDAAVGMSGAADDLAADAARALIRRVPSARWPLLEAGRALLMDGHP